MIAVDGARHSDFLLACLHELQDGHLRGRVLHGHPIRAQSQHGLAALPDLGFQVVGVSHQDLFSECQGTAELRPGLGAGVGHFGIEFFRKVHRHDDILNVECGFSNLER